MDPFGNIFNVMNPLNVNIMETPITRGPLQHLVDAWVFKCMFIYIVIQINFARNLKKYIESPHIFRYWESKKMHLLLFRKKF